MPPESTTIICCQSGNRVDTQTRNTNVPTKLKQVNAELGRPSLCQNPVWAYRKTQAKNRCRHPKNSGSKVVADGMTYDHLGYGIKSSCVVSSHNRADLEARLCETCSRAHGLRRSEFSPWQRNNNSSVVGSPRLSAQSR